MTSVEHAMEILNTMLGTQTFRSRFPNARLLATPADIEEAQEGLPASLLPFMRDEQPQWPDVYALDLTDRQRNRVVVWSDHAIVADWSTLDEFLQWLRESPLEESPGAMPGS